MHRPTFIDSTITVKNLNTTIIESCFIPFDILLIVCTILVILLATLFLFVIVLDRKCHTVPMLLIANSCASAFIWGCVLLSVCIFTLKNDLKQIQCQDSLCIYRTYFNYASPALFRHSNLLQAIYRYITVVHPHRLFWKSGRFQLSVICFIWIFCLIYPLGFMFSSEMLYIYNVDNQICQLPLRFSFPRVYAVLCIYIIPMSMIMLIYFKLIRYVYGMRKRLTPAKTLLGARRQLKMVQRIVKIVIKLLTFGLPYILFLIMSLFTNPPKYHFRIAYIFIDISLVFVMIDLFLFTDPFKASIMKKIKRR